MTTKGNRKDSENKHDNSGDSEIKTDAESDTDSGNCCMKDSPSSWLEKWWESKSSRVKSRILMINSGKKNNPTAPGTESNNKRKNGKRTRISTSTLEEFVKSEAQAKDTYLVEFHAPDGLGISLFVSYDGDVEIEGIHYLPNGKPSPALACGKLKVGDELIQLNEINLETLTFQAKTNILKDLDLYAKDVVTLGFRYGRNDSPVLATSKFERNRDYTDVMSTNKDGEKDFTKNTTGNNANDSDYDNESDDSDGEGATQLNLVQCGHQHQQRSLDKRKSTEAASDFVTYSTRNKPVIHSENPRAKDDISDSSAGVRNSVLSSVSTSVGIAPRKDDAIDNFLAIFGGMDDSLRNHAYGESELQGFRGVLQSMNSWQRHTTYSASTLKTSELALIHREILSRHLYPSVARTSTIASGQHAEHVLRELAEDIFEWRPYQLSYMYSGYFSQSRYNPSSLSTNTQDNKNKGYKKAQDEVPFSSLIVSPADTANYKYTQHLWWDEGKQAYVPMRPLAPAQLRTFLDHKDSMQGVLLRLELEAQRRALAISENNQRIQVSMSTSTSRGNTGAASVWRNSTTANDFFEAELDVVDGDQQIGAGDSAETTPDVKYKQRILNMNSPDDSPSPVRLLRHLSHTQTPLGRASQQRQNEREICGMRILGEAASVEAASLATITQSQLSEHGSIWKGNVHTPYISYYQRQQAAHRANYFKRAYEHIISPDHSSVQRILLQDSSVTIIKMVNEAIDSEISDLIETTNPFENARHCDTDTDISLPNILLTYQIFYAIQSLPESILNGREIYSLLERWATTFNPKGITSSLYMQKKSVASKSTRTTLGAGEGFRINASIVAPSTVTASAGGGGGRGRGCSEGVSERCSKEFMVYFGNNRRTARNMYVFVEVISDLLSLMVLGRIAPESLTRAWNQFHQKSMPSSAGDRTAFRQERTYQLRHLSVQVDLPAQQNNSRTRMKTTSEDNVSAGFVRKFGGLLYADTIAYVCCFTQFRETLSAVLQSSLLLDNEFSATSKQLQDFLLRSRAAVMGAAQFLDKVDHLTSSTTAKPYAKINCMILLNLRFLFENNVAVAVDLAVLCFPHIRPWNVYMALFGERGVEDTDFGCSSGSSGSNSALQPLVQAASTYYSYITRLMRSQYDVCSKDPGMVLTWLDLALQLDAEHAISQDEPVNTLFFSPQGKRKSSYLVTVRTILQRPREYSLSLFDALRVCGAHEFCEGVVLLCERWVKQESPLSGTFQRIDNKEDRNELERILESTVGQIFMQFVLEVEGSQSNKSFCAARTKESFTAAAGFGDCGSGTAMITHICALLAQSITVLRDVYFVNSSENEALTTQQLAKTLESVVEESLGVVVSKSDALKHALVAQVTNIFGDVLLNALDTRYTLAVLKASQSLFELVS